VARARAGVDILTFGQYLQPTPAHLDVAEYVTPEAFERWRRYGEDVVGFRCGCGGPSHGMLGCACAVARRAQRCSAG
jgi:lipoate synthase